MSGAAVVVTDSDTLKAIVGEAVRAAVTPLVAAAESRLRPPAHCDLIDQRELAGLLRVDVRTVRRLVREDAVPAPIMIGGRIPRWRRGEIDTWLKSGAAISKPRLRSARKAGSCASVSDGSKTS